MSPERQIDVEWRKESAQTYPVKILIVAYDRVGLLADAATEISKSQANIISVNTSIKDNKMVELFLTMSVEDTAHINRVMGALRKIQQVQDVIRINA
jgi:GTP pyrophosphokinase